MVWPQFFASHTFNRETYCVSTGDCWIFKELNMQPLQSAVLTLLAALDVITLARLVWLYEDYKHIPCAEMAVALASIKWSLLC
jgi:hypothetical protein